MIEWRPPDNPVMRKIASRVSQLNGEGALAVYARAKELEREGRSIIHLELGEPDFHPAAPVVDAVRDAVAAGRDRYCSTRGVPALREAIAEYLKRTRRLEVVAEQVLVALVALGFRLGASGCQLLAEAERTSNAMNGCPAVRMGYLGDWNMSIQSFRVVSCRSTGPVRL